MEEEEAELNAPPAAKKEESKPKGKDGKKGEPAK